MTKTQTPSSITIDGIGKFITNAVPDPFDERDLVYRPRLEPLKARIDQRDDKKKHLFVLQQTGNSCTGHAVASLIQTVTRGLVSPYMLYYYARRYDQFEGEEDIGSSLRGAFKGWFYHGVALKEDWLDLDPPTDLDLESPRFLRKCRERPLGAFYRVNPYRLDDMQSAINELGAIAVSAAIHNGWANPIVMQRRKKEMYLIARPVDAHALGGHAFALVGYNDVGFLVQNSWGTDWGKGGYATLPYEDWLENAYDAWVARPGVPQTPFYAGHTQNSTGTGGALVTVPGPDLKRLAAHVINLGNNGKLSQGGRFRSTPRQIESIFQNMERWHNYWQQTATSPLQRHIVLYAHGGMVTESDGLLSAEQHLNWWLNNQVYPIYFVWETGPRETLLGHVYDLAKSKLPFGMIGFDFMEQVDRWIEKRIAPLARWLWEEIKQNARAASGQIQAPEKVNWQLDHAGRLSPEAEREMQAMPGASLLVTRLARYIAQHGREHVTIHLVGHSAGTVFHASLLEHLAEVGMRVDSLAFLAAALRVDEFWQRVMPRLGAQGNVNRFANFVLSDSRELEDGVLPQPGPALYHKSILYLLSRGAELPAQRSVAPDDRAYEVPMMGMQRFMNQRLSDLPGLDNRASILREEIEGAGGQVISSPSAASEADSRSEATMHTDFDSNPATMASVMMRILNVKEPAPQYNYPAYAALYPTGADGSPLIAAPAVGVEPALQTVEANMPGTTPLVEMAEPQMQAAKAPPPAEPGPIPEVAVAPHSEFPVVDILQDEGWQMKGKPKSR
jgi:hypothetical protein